MTRSIERSAGIVVRAGLIPFTVGGGYSGATDDLDAAVDAAATKLLDLFDHPVTIRFNSDRRSGSAWLKTSEVDTIGSNAEVGVGASLFNLADMRRSDEDSNRRFKPKEPVDLAAQFTETCKRLGLDESGPNEQIKFSAKVDRSYLRDPDAFELQDSTIGEARLYRSFDTLDEAVAFVREHVVADPKAVTARNKRKRAAEQRKLVSDTATAIAALDKRQLARVVWKLDYHFRPAHMSFLPNLPKENKEELRQCIIAAVKAGAYRYRMEDAVGSDR